MAELEDGPSDSPRPLPELIGGRYRIVSRLGVGGMGVVYKATDIQLKRSVAIKALEERRLHIPGAATRLKNEALAAASLDHPYICKVYELLETSTDTFIVMEYIEGETLTSILKRGVLPLLQTLQLAREIAEGLANAHARGLVHRDVKPSNVMVTTHGHVKLLDFGVAGVDVESTSKDETRTLTPQLTVHAGTPQYMAPEQAAGQPITTRADLFSLGVVLYECLTGHLPFSGSTTFDYVRHVMQSPPKRLDKVAPETPADLVDLVDRLLEKTPADRPESADDVVKQLRQLEDAFTAPTRDIRTARQARAGRRWKLVAGAAILIATIALSWRFIWPRTESADVPRQLRPFVTTSAAESGSRISPDGQWVSFISTAGGASRIMVQRIDGGEPRPLTLTPGRPVSQAWSPDSNQIAGVLSLDGGHVLQLYPAFFGGVPTQSISLGEGLTTVELVRWIGRDIYLRVQGRQSAIFVRRISLDAPSAGTPVSDAWSIDGTIRGVDIRPDGLAVVVAVAKDSLEHLWTLNLDGSSRRQLTNDAFFDRYPRWIGNSTRVMFQSNRGGQVDLWQIDVESKAMSPLTSSEGEEIPESSSADGQNLSFQQLTRDANLWTFGTTSSQITQDSLSDYTPVLSADGKALAFQRSQPTPSRGYTILDAKVFYAPFEGKPVLEPSAIADGFAPDLSHDGQWLAYLQMGDRPTRMKLSVRDMRGGATIPITSFAGLPSLALAPIEWSARTTAWSHTENNLYFVELSGEPESYSIRRYRAGEASAGPPVAKGLAPGAYIRDPWISPETGRLAYISSAKDVGAAVHELDPQSGAVRDIVRFAPKELNAGLALRGWLDRSLILVRSLAFYEDRSSDVEILVLDGSGNMRTVGRVPTVFGPTIRLNPSNRSVYMTRTESGTHNVFILSVDTGALTAVTQNALPGVTFSGFRPLGAQGVLGVREERRDDIWLIQQTVTPRTGNPAGR